MRYVIPKFLGRFKHLGSVNFLLCFCSVFLFVFFTSEMWDLQIINRFNTFNSVGMQFPLLGKFLYRSHCASGTGQKKTPQQSKFTDDFLSLILLVYF